MLCPISNRRFVPIVLQSLFVLPIPDFPGCTRGDRTLMWGETTSFCDELTGDFGGGFEATSIDSCRLFCRSAEIQSHGVLGQHNLP
jgi:hypothetical protein